jgi:hypothetical protein
MDAPEDRIDAAEARQTEIEREREAPSGEKREEKPAVEPFDPYFGRKKRDGFFWV